MKYKFSIKDCQISAANNDGYCLDIEFLGVMHKYKWHCKNNHEWETTYNSVQQGKWCKKCAGLEKHTIKDCSEAAKQKNGYFLSEEYKNIDTKYMWKCDRGHMWEASFYDIKRGHWCKKCDIDIRKCSIEDCHKLAKNNDGLCLSTEYTNSRSYYEWQCSNGHKWFAKYTVVQQGKWCAKCVGLEKHTIGDCCQLAKNNNGKCLTTEYANVKFKYEWECDKGHRWYSTYNKIQQGRWCPECSIGKTQKQLQNIVENLLNMKAEVNYRKFEWLKDKIKLEIDIWFPNLRLAIEYDGQQHFNSIEYFGGIKAFKQTQKRDKLKNKLILTHADDVQYFIRFDYKEPITKEYILQKLIDNNIPIN